MLGLEVVSQYHGKEAAVTAQKAAEDLVKGGGKTQTDVVPEFSLTSVQFPAKLFFIVSASGLCKSSSDARRQIQGGAVKLDGDRVDQVDLTFESAADLIGRTLSVGTKRFVRLVL